MMEKKLKFEKNKGKGIKEKREGDRKRTGRTWQGREGGKSDQL